MATRDSAAAPGRLRLLLRSQDEVRQFHNALHGQTDQIGMDRVAIERVGTTKVRASATSGYVRRTCWSSRGLR